MGLSEGRHNKNSRVMGTASSLQAWGPQLPGWAPSSATDHLKGNTAAPMPHYYDAHSLDTAAAFALGVSGADKEWPFLSHLSRTELLRGSLRRVCLLPLEQRKSTEPERIATSIFTGLENEGRFKDKKMKMGGWANVASR